MLKRLEQWQARLAGGYLALLMTLFLFWTGTEGYTNLIAPKYRLFCWLCGGYLALSLGLELPALASCVERRALLHGFGWPQRLLAAYLLLSALAWACSPHRAESWLGMTRHEGLATILLYGLSCLQLARHGRARPWMAALLGLSGTASAVLCLLQLAGLNPLGLYPEGMNYGDAYVKYSGAYLGTVGNVDLVAAVLCLAIPLLAGSVCCLRQRRRWLLLLPLALLLAVLLWMNVTAGLVGLTGLLPALAVWRSRGRRRKMILLAMAVAGCGLLLALWLVDLPVELWHQGHALLRGQAEDSFGTGRVYIWRQVLARVGRQFWLGSGPDTMAAAHLTPFSRYDAAQQVMRYAQIDVAHNEYLNILFHQGLPALGCYLAMLAMLGWRWLHTRSAAAAILGAGVLCYAVQALFGFSMCPSAPFFWAVLGLLMAALRQPDNETNPKSNPQSSSGQTL